MLGLGQNLSFSSIMEETPVVTYESDFSSSVESFEAYFDNSTPVTTLTHGVTFGGKTNALRASWSGSEEDGLMSIRKSFSDLDNQDNLYPRITFSADVYFDFSSGANVTAFAQAGSPILAPNRIVLGSFAKGAWVNINGTLTPSASTTFDEYLYIGIAAGAGRPENGDSMYVKNIVFTFENKA